MNRSEAKEAIEANKATQKDCDLKPMEKPIPNDGAISVITDMKNAV